VAVDYERRGASAVVTIDRQERRNAVDGPTAEELNAAYRRFEGDDDARVMILTGAGGVAFCAGADLKNIESFGPRMDLEDGPLGFSRLTPSKPTIAAISGWCLAGGLELALWCDLRIAAEGSTLGFPERRWGVPLVDGGTVRLPRLIGLSRALDLILTGRPVDAREAERIGLANRVVPPGQARAAAEALAAEIAAFPARCVVSDRRSAYEGAGADLETALAREFALGKATVDSGESREGAARFADGAGRHGKF
jgi:enoyl-CoA hydratase